jgi:hypothetical protein
VAKPVAAPTAAQAAPEAAAVAVAPSTPIERMREQLLVEARRDIEAVSTSRGGGQ